jgi:hypothetical protein
LRKVLHTGFLKSLLYKTGSLLLLLLLFSTTIDAQKQSATAIKIKSVFLFNFTRFIDWPASSFSSPGAPFVIAIAGDNPFGKYIEETVVGESVGTHPIIVNYVNNENDLLNCHLLYLNYPESARNRQALNSLENRSILTVGESSEFSRWGGIVRFYTEQNKIRLEINTEAAKEAQLNISSKLLSVAKTN